MALSQKRVPTVSETDTQRAFQQVYDDMNEIINAVNQGHTSKERISNIGKSGDIRIGKNALGNHFLELCTDEGWVISSNSVPSGFILKGDVEDSNDTHILGGKVGIGTASPSAKFHLSASGTGTTVPHARFECTTENDLNVRLKANTKEVTFKLDDTTGHLHIQNNTYNRLTIQDGGNVGIGTGSPNAKITIEGTMSMKEQSDDAASVAGYSQIWVDDAGNGTLMFTNDAGTKYTVDVTAV